MGICVVSTRLMWISQDDTMYTRGASWLALKCYSTQDLTGVPVPWCDVTRPQPGTDYSPPCLSKGVLLLFDYIEGELLKWKETPKCTLGGGIIPADLLRPCRNFSAIQIYSYSYSERNCLNEYIRICIQSWKKYSVTSDLVYRGWKEGSVQSL